MQLCGFVDVLLADNDSESCWMVRADGTRKIRAFQLACEAVKLQEHDSKKWCELWRRFCSGGGIALKELPREKQEKLARLAGLTVEQLLEREREFETRRAQDLQKHLEFKQKGNSDE